MPKEKAPHLSTSSALPSSAEDPHTLISRYGQDANLSPHQHLIEEEVISEPLLKAVQAGILIQLDSPLREQMSSIVTELSAKAQTGSLAGISLLLMLAIKSTNALNELAQTNPSALQNIANRELRWPVIASRSNQSIASIRQFLKEIGLGEKPDIPVDSASFQSRETPARRFLLEAIKTIETARTVTSLHAMLSSPGSDNSWISDMHVGSDIADSELFTAGNNQFLKDCYQLPELSVETINEWFPLIQRVVLHTTQQHPEDNLDLRPLGMGRANKAPDGSASQAAHIRAGIFEKLKLTLQTIAPDSP